MASAALALAYPPEEAPETPGAGFGMRTALGARPDDERRRELMARRLADLLFLPGGQVSPHEKGLVDEILSRLYGGLAPASRTRLAKRIHNLAEPPRRLLRLMAADAFEIAGPFLERPELFEDSELAALVGATAHAHHLLVAHRTGLGPRACAALIETGDGEVIAALIANPSAALDLALLRHLAALARTNPGFAARLLARADLPAVIAHEMFWWAESGARQAILHRYSMERRLLGEAVADLFQGEDEAEAMDLDWAMRLTGARRVPPSMEGEALSALAGWLGALDAAEGPDGEAVDAMAEALLVTPATIRRIGADRGGEAVAVLLKALGLSLSQFKTMAPLLQARAAAQEGSPDHLLALFGSLSTDWADLVLRLWDLQAEPEVLS